MMHQISANTRLCRVCIWPRPLSALAAFRHCDFNGCLRICDGGSLWNFASFTNMAVPSRWEHDSSLNPGALAYFQTHQYDSKIFALTGDACVLQGGDKKSATASNFRQILSPQRDGRLCQCVCVCLSRMKFYQEMECDICFEHFKAWFFGCQDHFIALNSIVETSCLHVPGIHNEPLASMTLYLILD